MASDDKKQIFDVAKPGKSAPDASSRPIITGHKMMQDPMVSNDAAKSDEKPSGEPIKNTESLPVTRNKVIVPISDDKNPSTKSDGGEKLLPDAEAKEASEEPKKDESSSAEAAVVDAVAEQVTAKKKENEATEADKEKQEALNKLVEDKTYFVKVRAAHRQRNVRAGLFVVILMLLGLVGVGLAADAELLNLGFKPPFDLIKKEIKQAATTAPMAPVETATNKVEIPKDPIPIDTESATWKLVKSAQNGFSVRIPDGWEVARAQVGDSVQASSITYQKGVPAVIEDASSSFASTGLPRFEIVQYKTSVNYNPLKGDEQKSDFSAGMLKATKYYKKYPVAASSAANTYPGMEQYIYEFKTSDKVTYVTYNIFHYNQYSKTISANFTKSDVSQVELVEKVVRTLVIN